MNVQKLQCQLAEAQASVLTLQEELAQTHRGLLSLTMELEQRVDERTVELRKANFQLQAEIAERKQAEEALRKAGEELSCINAELEQKVQERTARLRETLGELEAFSYSLSHDLRTPLRAITGFTELVLYEHRDRVGEEGAAMLERSLKSARRMEQLIIDVLTLTRMSRAELHPASIDPEKLIRQIIHERQDFQLPKARLTLQAPLIPVLGDETSLTQCLTNLLGNAVKYVVKGVVPDVRIWTEELPASFGSASLEPLAARPTSFVRLWVGDNGIGIAPEFREKVFELFQRIPTAERYDGTGIGLAIVRKAVERMGGRVGVDSEPGKGSRFWLELRKADC